MPLNKETKPNQNISLILWYFVSCQWHPSGKFYPSAEVQLGYSIESAYSANIGWREGDRQTESERSSLYVLPSRNNLRLTIHSILCFKYSQRDFTSQVTDSLLKKDWHYIRFKKSYHYLRQYHLVLKISVTMHLGYNISIERAGIPGVASENDTLFITLLTISVRFFKNCIHQLFNS